MPSIEELQAQLAEKIAQLDVERKSNLEKQVKEQEEKQLVVEAKLKLQRLEYEKKIAEHTKKKIKEEAEREAQRIKDIAERVAMEQKQNAVHEALRLQQEELEQLKVSISNAEFAEEQHRKSVENTRVSPIAETLDIDEINVEHPESPSNSGEAVSGTSGDTPDSPLMSQHLKQILRQAQRNY